MDNKGRTILLSNTIFILEKDQKQRVIKGFLSSEVNESISETEADIRIAKPGKKMGHDRQMLKYIELGLKEGYNIIFDIEEIKNPKQLEQTFYQIYLRYQELIIFMKKIINIIIAMTVKVVAFYY